MSTSAIKAGSAFYEIMVADKTSGGLDKAQARLRAFSGVVGSIGASLSAVAAAGLAGFGAAVREFMDFGSNINDFAARTGVSTDWAQSFKVGAELAGSSLADVEGAIRKMQKTLAKSGQLKGASTPEQQFIAVADALLAIEDPTLRAAKAQEVFGRSGAKLLPMLADLRKNYAFLSDNGLILKESDIAAADKLGDTWDILNLTLAQSVRIVGAALAPSIIKLIEYVTTGTVMVAQFINANRALVVGLAIATSVIGAVGLSMLGLSSAAMVTSFAMTGLSAIGGIWTAVASAATIATAALAAVMGVLLSPVALIVASVAALAVLIPVLGAVLGNLATNGYVFQFLGEQMQALWKTATTVVKGIYDAIVGGRWDLAGLIAVQGLVVVWEQMVYALKAAWIDFGSWIQKSLFTTFGGVIAQILEMENRLAGVTNRLGITNIDTKENQDTIDALNDPKKVKDVTNQIDAEAAVRKDQARANLRQKQKELDALVGQAANARKEVEKEFTSPFKSFKPGAFRFDASKLDTNVSTENKAMTSLGAISAAAANRIGSNIPTFEPMVKQQEMTNELLGQIADQTKDMGEEFGE